MLRGSNRSGKTQGAVAEVAMAFCGCHPFIDYPKENGVGYCIGWDHKHVGKPMWRKLGRPGAFKVIKDEHTKLLRAVRPWQEYDLAYQERWKDAPPLIPPRMIKEIAWESKKEQIPRLVKGVNGWELSFFSSKGDEAQGAEIDFWWLDEEIENQE